MLEAGLTPEMACALTGHRSLSMLRRYQLIKTEKVADAFSELEASRATAKAKAANSPKVVAMK
jgi:hypothetical protein